MKNLCFLFVLCAVALAQEQSLDQIEMRVKAIEPADARKTFLIEKGFSLELVAAEPDVTDPCAAAFDEDGRMYVCEFRDYPQLPPKGQPPLGRVRLLQNPDANGRYTKSTIFAGPLPYPSGVVCWRGGVFVASAPDIWYFKDTDDDGVADVKEKIFTGFGTGEVYAVVNTLQWGLDNKIYGSSSYNRGNMKAVGNENTKRVSLGSRDFRFDPVTRELEAVSGNAEFGNTFDDWGNRFICNATNVIFHPVLPDHYLARNPNLAAPRVQDQISSMRDFAKIHPISAPEPWKATREKFWSKFLGTRGDLNAGRFPKTELAPQGFVTSSAGVTIYRGSAYPVEYRGNSFTGEPANNLVVRLALKSNGVSFTADRPTTEKKEFLASTDNWFRPVNFVNAPDGCLYILDMYREVIEDESAIPDAILKKLDMTSGRDHGRIWRIVPDGFKRPAPPRIGKAGIRQILAALESRDGWMRDTAQRLLVERADKNSIEPLRKLALSSKLPQARVHALHTLDALQSIDEPTLVAALRDANPYVREHALRAGESQLNDSMNLLAIADDPEPRVRFQCAFSLSAVKSDTAVAALAKIARRDANDPWIRTAVLVAAAGREGALLKILLAGNEPLSEKIRTDTSTLLCASLAALVGSTKDEKQITAALEVAKGAQRQFVVRGIADGLSRAGGSVDTFANAFAPFFEDSRRVALDANRPGADRIAEMQFLSVAPASLAAPVLRELLAPAQTPEIQMAAVKSLSALRSPDAGGWLLEGWRGYSPQLRREVVEALFRDAARLPALLDAIEKKQISTAEIDPARQEALLKHRDKKIRQRAEQLIRADPSTSLRASVVAKYQDALKLEGNAERGKEIYLKTCATCHKLGKEGREAGPNLDSVRNHTAEQILLDILDPNAKVQPNYVNYTLVTADGEEYSGILAEETATSVTLRRAEGAQDIILRNRIKELRSSNLSLMPDNLEQGLTPQHLADLIRYVQNAAP